MGIIYFLLCLCTSKSLQQTYNYYNNITLTNLGNCKELEKKYYSLSQNDFHTKKHKKCLSEEQVVYVSLFEGKLRRTTAERIRIIPIIFVKLCASWKKTMPRKAPTRGSTATRMAALPEGILSRPQV